MTHYESIEKLQKKLKVMKGGGIFPNIIIEDSQLPQQLEGKLFNLGDDEHVTLRRVGVVEPRRHIQLYPVGSYHKRLHLQTFVINHRLFINSINTELLDQSKGIGTYLFELLFEYLKYQGINFTQITLIFGPSRPDKTDPNYQKEHYVFEYNVFPPHLAHNEKRIVDEATDLRAMRFYFKVFSTLADFYPMVGPDGYNQDDQLTQPTEETYKKVIDDISDNERSVILFKKRR